MGKSLIIVESPAKTRTLKTFLGENFDIKASMGHVRDLPKSKLGVDIEHDFEPSYVTLKERRETLKDLKQAAEKSDRVYLASDPDREGEAIAWHVAAALNLENPLRIEFNEITRQAVQRALDHPRTLDLKRFNAQQARRILDRLVGYKLSPLLWKKVKGRLSAGRVQSVAVRLVCDREREIQAFVPQEYWSIIARLTPLDREKPFDARLIEKHGKKLELGKEEEAQQVLRDLEGASYVVSEVKTRRQKRNPAAPFITSTLQQEAARRLGFSAKRTMTVAQQLYEGIDMGGDGHVGLITYMRTDSTRIATEAAEEAKGYIEGTYGKEYLPATPRQYRAAKGAQEAHEAVRPTSILRSPDKVKGHITADQLKLYTLVWQRFVASQMAPAELDVTTVNIKAGDYTFRATGSIMRFDGFTRVYTEGRDDVKQDDEDDRQVLPDLSVDEKLRLLGLTPKQHFTEPPPRFSEATLVKALEELGIGRPSTYATIIDTIQDRGYANLEEKRFRPTELGFTVTDLLVAHFPDILDAQFTAAVESKLDDVEEGDQDWVRLLKDFYEPFDRRLAEANEKAERVRIEPVLTEEICPNCGRQMALRQGRFGPFLGCSGFPECRTILSTPDQKLDVNCPKPDCPGHVVQKKSKKGRTFYGCSEYPACDFVTWNKPIDQICTTCGYPMGEKSWRGRVSGLECTNEACPTVVAARAEREARAPKTTEAKSSVAKSTAAKSTTTKSATAKSAATKKAATTKKTTTKAAPSSRAKAATKKS
ncbi:MAG TPA: type I DNA topoisomerase [Armatimonadota bacterium]|jgi:DNA topoisomerase-1